MKTLKHSLCGHDSQLSLSVSIGVLRSLDFLGAAWSTPCSPPSYLPSSLEGNAGESEDPETGSFPFPWTSPYSPGEWGKVNSFPPRLLLGIVCAKLARRLAAIQCFNLPIWTIKDHCQEEPMIGNISVPMQNGSSENLGSHVDGWIRSTCAEGLRAQPPPPAAFLALQEMLCALSLNWE